MEIGVFDEKDTTLQIARCSFDLHVADIMGTLIAGGTLVMLRPNGLLDLSYLVDVLVRKRITYFCSVPSFVSTLCLYLETRSEEGCLNHVRSLCSGGE